MKLIIHLGTAMLVTGVAVAAPALPVPSHDTLLDYQDACVAQNGFKTFSAQVSCVKALAAESNMNDPSTRLYLLTADKLLDDVRSKRVTVPAARVELQRALIDAEQHQRAESLAIQNAKQEQWQAEQRARQQAAREEEREEEQRQQITQQRQLAQAQADAQAMAAIQNCISLARERQNALATSSNATVRANYGMQQGLSNAFGRTPERACQSDPNWYRTIPIAPQPTVTQRSHCESDQMGGYDCTSQ